MTPEPTPSDLHVVKDRADATLVLSNGESPRGWFFVAGGSAHHAGAERVGDLLNDDNRKSLSEMLVSLRNLTQALDKHSGDIDATLENLKVATASMSKTLDSVDHVLNSADKTLGTVSTAAGSPAFSPRSIR